MVLFFKNTIILYQNGTFISSDLWKNVTLEFCINAITKLIFSQIVILLTIYFIFMKDSYPNYGGTNLSLLTFVDE